MLKLLVSAGLLGALGTTVATGTWASFTASSANSATFATGTLVLSNQKDTATACLSAGGGSTDTNVNSSCDVLFNATSDANATSRRPGEGGSVTMHLRNEGSVAGTLSVMSAANCTVSNPLDQPISGTGNACNAVQLAIGDGTTCYWGDNMGTSTTKPYITGSALTYPLTVAATDNRFKLTVDGVAHDNLQLTPAVYLTAALFAVQVNLQISAWATATATASGAIRIESKTATPSSNVSLAIPSTSLDATGLSAMGFIDGSSASAPGVCATKTGDPDHTLAAFRTATTSTALSLGSLAASTTRDFTVALSVPSVIVDEMQGRKTGFELTWGLTQ